MTTIGFDGACLGAHTLSGVERSFLLTLDAFVKRGTRCIVWVPPCAPDLPAGVVRREFLGPSFVWRQRALPRQLADEQVDLWLSPTTTLPATAPCRTVSTVHDLPDRDSKGPPLSELRQAFARERLGARAWRVIVPSQRTRVLLLRAHPELGERARIVPQPIDPRFFTSSRAREPRGYVVVGGARRRKNLDRLRAAWAQLPATLRRRHPLHQVGAQQTVTTESLARLIGESLGVVMPSMAEGFGIPALESLALGRPVLGSRATITEDLCGDLAALVNPFDMHSIQRGLERMVHDRALQARAAEHGPALAATFTPERSADAWCALIDEALK